MYSESTTIGASPQHTADRQDLHHHHRVFLSLLRDKVSKDLVDGQTRTCVPCQRPTNESRSPTTQNFKFWPALGSSHLTSAHIRCQKKTKNAKKPRNRKYIHSSKIQGSRKPLFLWYLFQTGLLLSKQPKVRKDKSSDDEDCVCWAPFGPRH